MPLPPLQLERMSPPLCFSLVIYREPGGSLLFLSRWYNMVKQDKTAAPAICLFSCFGSFTFLLDLVSIKGGRVMKQERRKISALEPHIDR